uniref:Ig-like domain-containing protein n=1 Tax=Xiphophorus maculatus TaxID=8083 RepID=A0A3B5QMH6_XIPMA
KIHFRCISFLCQKDQTESSRLLKRLQGTWLHWYKQSAGGTLKFIVMQQKSIDPKYDPNAPASRMKATIDDKLGNLTIMETVLQDEGMYHCARMDWTESIWSGTYLSIKVSDPARPADSENLQCSVVSESEDKACSGELNVFWFRTGSEQSHPEIIYTNDKELHICENTLTSNAQKKCSYSFSKNFNSSDTLYCAVATCGEILFGKETKPTAVWTMTKTLMYFILSTQTKDGQEMNYAALHFDEGKTSRRKIKTQLKTEESVYSQVKYEVVNAQYLYEQQNVVDSNLSAARFEK